MSSDALFLDTSILIAFFIHEQQIKEEIDKTTKRYSFCVTGLVAKAEFTRRLLGDADYLLRLCSETKSFAGVFRRVNRLGANPFNKHKFQTCLSILASIHEMDSDEESQLDRLELFLESLLESSWHYLEDVFLGAVIPDSGCALGLAEIKKAAKRYILPKTKCEGFATCGMYNFLRKTPDRDALIEYLNQKKDEKKFKDAPKISELLEGLEILQLSSSLSEEEFRAQHPCKRCGDTLISLESRSINNFFTLDYKASNWLCEQSGQNLTICPSSITSKS